MSRAEGFAAIPNWMIRDRRVPRNAILVYASLSSRAGMGAIFPSQVTIAEESGLSDRTVRRMMSHLEELGVVERRTRRGGKGKSTSKTDAYTLHPNGRVEGSDNLSGSSEGPDSEGQGTGHEQHGVPLTEVDRDEVDRETSAVAAASTIGQKFAQPLCDVLVAELVKNGVKVPSPLPKKWLDDARLMVDRDGRDPRQAKALIEWACRDSFWRSNIQSMPTFRRQYDKLRLQAQAGRSGSKATTVIMVVRLIGFCVSGRATRSWRCPHEHEHP